MPFVFPLRAACAGLAVCLTAGTAVAVAAPAAAQDYSPLVHALTTDNRLLSSRLDAPAAVVADVAVTGLAPDEDLVGIDVRPATGVLYALTTQARVYAVDPSTGLATDARALTLPLAGGSFGIDFDPLTGLLRAVSDAGQNLAVDVDTGVTRRDQDLRYVAGDPGAGFRPDGTALAHTHNVVGDPAARPYGIDAARDVLVRHLDITSGGVETVGALGLDIGTASGMDVDLGGARAYAVLRRGGDAVFSTVDLATGTATPLATLADTVEDVAVARIRLAVEGGAGREGGMTSFTVRRGGEVEVAVSVDYATTSLVATAGEDFTSVSGRVSFAAGEREKVVSVPALADDDTEGPERFTVTLSNPSPLVLLSPAQAQATVLDADPAAAYGLSSSDEIVRFSLNDTSTITHRTAVSGLQPDEDLLAIDVRPATGQLLALGDSERIYVIDPDTGEARTLVTVGQELTAFTSYDVDVDPVTDTARILGHRGQNLRVDLTTGQTTAGPAPRYADGDPEAGSAPQPVAAAHSNNVAGAATSTFYVLDDVATVLSTERPGEDGVLVSIGRHGVTLGNTGAITYGLDIATRGGAAFALLYNGAADEFAQSIYRIDLSTGTGHRIGRLGPPGNDIEDLALASVTPSASTGPSPATSAAPTTGPPSPPSTVAAPRTGLTLQVTGPGVIVPNQQGVLRAQGEGSAEVELRCYSRPSTTYVTARRALLDAAGQVEFRVTPGTNTRCFVAYAGASDADPRSSGSVVQAVATALSLSVRRLGVRDYVFEGRILPRRSGQLITLYRLANGREILTQQVRTDATGTWRIRRQFTGSGTFVFVARTGQNLTNVAGRSNTRRTAIF